MDKSTEELANALRGIDEAECAYACSEKTPCAECLRADEMAGALEYYLKKTNWTYRKPDRRQQ